VLVVGGSLVGLSAAVFLGWRGVPSVLVERHRLSSTRATRARPSRKTASSHSCVTRLELSAQT